ncbi:MAG: PEP/pyruvate-binding domain-containing protein, partial [Chloroflexota bacterium]
QHLAAAGVQEHLTALAGVPAEQADTPATVRHLDAVRAAMLAIPVASAVANAIGQLLAQDDLAGVPLAVRSSATAEDSAEASFAGIHESVLNVTGLDAVLAAIRECYASVWTSRALAYRRRLGVADDAVACAVVLCAMVGGAGQRGTPPIAAGVAFSADPRTGRRDRIVVNAAPGLGDALVGGTVNPVEIEIQADFDGLEMVERRGEPAGLLSDVQALALGQLVERVHWALGEGQQPQDLEWVFDGERFWLVQARPITHLPRLVPEPVRNLPVIWSNGNLKDAVAGVPSALGYSLLQPVLRTILYTYLQALGYPVQDGMETIRRIDGRVYFDLTTMQWLVFDGVGLTPAEVNLTLGGMQPEIPVPGRPFQGRDGYRRAFAQVRLLKLLWHSANIYEREIASVRRLVQQRWRDDLSNLSSPEILAWRDETASIALEFSRLFQINNAGSFWDKTLSDLIDRVRPGSGTRITSALLAGSNTVVTAEHGYRLVDLARLAEAEPEVAAYLDTTPLDPWGWRALPPTSTFRREFERFLEEFGHRGVYEAEIANPRWIEDPTYLLEQIRSFIGQYASLGGRDKAAQRRLAAEREVRSLPFWIRPAVNWLARRARRAAALREAGKSALVSTLLTTRKMSSELGQRLVAAGVLDRPEDIFHLTWWDIVSWAEGHWAGNGARALVADRASQHRAWLALEPPDVFVLDAQGQPTEMPREGSAAWPPAHTSHHEQRASAGAQLLTGAGVSSGRARGIARVIRHPSDGARLQPGEILIAPSTDPGWTPIFLRASAVVMEVGGYLSHGAIVAREYGLPAVVNVPGALTTIRDGQSLEVNGDTGEILVAQADRDLATD